MIEISRAVATFSIAQIELNVSISGGGKGNLLRDVRVKRRAAQVGVQNDAGGVDYNL